MIALVEPNLEAIRALCREFGVLRLELFGSAATGEFDPVRSDLDFLVAYPSAYDFGSWLSRQFELQDRLAALLGRPVDLVMAGGLRNPYVIRSIDQTRRLLYAVQDRTPASHFNIPSKPPHLLDDALDMRIEPVNRNRPPLCIRQADPFPLSS